jgi:secondary thiamine-phosphate synthase enzyme
MAGSVSSIPVTGVPAYDRQYAVPYRISDVSHEESSRIHHITPQVEAALAKSGIAEGMILVSAMHITAGVYVNDAEDGLIRDIDEWLEGLAPFRENYRHHRTGETNGDSHLKSLLVHHEVIVPVTKGKLDFGPWQQVYYAEFDGQRAKRVIIKVMGE